MIDVIRNKAKEFGLAAVGIAPAIDEVRVVFDWAESVAVAAVPYLPPEQEKPGDGVPRGLIARVARGEDYHSVMRDRLSQLAGLIATEHPAARLEICVDTCPIPERKLAVLGGIGWRGKSGNVFVEGCGSYVALGEIITDLKLPPSEPLNVDACGDCDRCIRACPTGALTSPYTVDTSKCLSALTQVSGVIPRELRSAMGNRIYGCDVCQEVCPRNRSGLQTRHNQSEIANPGLSKVVTGAYPELIPLIRLSAAEFKECIKDSSIGWIRRTRIRRNAAIAAGNLGCEEAIPALVEMLGDENAVLRAVAAWALGEIGTPAALDALRATLLNDEIDAGVIEEIRVATSNR